eukprot:CAMPEP_0113623904 /NCGR_PEP_ID=MMETSP0017_2-20120614/12315_1 /TAXON_ID=2856 /ORGANISM="Cylindrotheca closterium" /LENGTH=93 /DNA_ID=CAMNT_0000533903 /DNA_START=1 /DNA_END=279 /DNA_ORIENTATION=- /assembly_acc=CAM_ASM_000147
MRRQASFLRKAAILDSIGKFEGGENLPPIGESSDAGKKKKALQTRIDKELKSMIKEMLQSRDFEDETDMEPEAREALVKAAKEVCYTRQYYDV